ncbi:MAG: glycosyltransferase family 4 protein [Methylacidiphilales bacterium]|nr:glycosyltransferase family 4 protein [Candidatus Methylacidiphilales bacterium]
MVQLMIRGLGGDFRYCPQLTTGIHMENPDVRVFHVNARVSASMEDVGRVKIGKLFRLCSHCLEAIWCRIRYGANVLYYVPAPAKASAILRDWIVMVLCRPFFPKLILHWHSSGLGSFVGNALESGSTWQKAIGRLTQFLLGRADLSIVLTEYSRKDADIFMPRKLVVIPNGIPDPCPDFESSILPQRQQRRQTLLHLRQKSEAGSPKPETENYRVLFLAHCTREKGLFDAIDAIALLNSKLKNQNLKPQASLTVAGQFMSESERCEFETRIAHPDLQLAKPWTQSAVRYAGFVSGEEKDYLLKTSDCLCFPSYYPNEVFPVTILEAMSYGLEIVLTSWKGIELCLPAGYPSIVPPKDPKSLAAALFGLALEESCRAWELRNHFLKNYQAAAFVEKMKACLSI